jgi:hypothetical protein
MVVELRALPTVIQDGATMMAPPLCDATTSSGREFTSLTGFSFKVEYGHHTE